MNRRGFLGLLGKLVQVGTAMGISPALFDRYTHPVYVVKNGTPEGVALMQKYHDEMIECMKKSGYDCSDRPTFTLAS